MNKKMRISEFPIMFKKKNEKFLKNYYWKPFRSLKDFSFHLVIYILPEYIQCIKNAARIEVWFLIGLDNFEFE